MKTFYSLFIIAILFVSYSFAVNVMIMEMENDGLVEKGFRDGILLEKPNTRFYTFGANGNDELLKMQIKASFKYNPSVFFTKGLESVKILSETINNNYPIVFVMIQDPVKNKVIASRKSPEINITGVTTEIPVLQQLKVMKKIRPFKKLAVLLPGGISNSQSVNKICGLEKFLDFKLLKIQYEGLEELYNKLYEANPDFIYIPSKINIEDEVIQLINRMKIPSVSEDSELVKKGVLLSLVIDNYKAGRLAANQALSILNGKKSNKIQVMEIQHFMVAVNIRTAQKINIQIPLSLLVIADKIVK
jgi:putative ABC transport system substrate-binding protein